MNVLVIGNGAREHAIVYTLKKSPQIGKIYAIEPNAAMAKATTVLQIDLSDCAALRAAIAENAIELVVVGPEKPLVAGIADQIGDICSVFGPTKAAAKLEGSKGFAKEFMRRYDIPTAASVVVTSAAEARQKAAQFDFPRVWKADGLAGGKGVFISNSAVEDEAIIKKLFVDRIFGDGANRVVLEEFLVGDELSVFALFDNRTYKYFSNARDFKRAYDDNLGPNTGGMGALSPIAVDRNKSQQIDSIIKKTFCGVKAEGLDYRGVLFIGLIETAAGYKVLEYNVRFGDPETQVILPRLKSDLLDIMYRCATNRLDGLNLQFDSCKAVNVVIASRGYPANIETGKVVDIGYIGDNRLFFGGCFYDAGLKTTSGRVFSLVGFSDSFAAASQKVYRAIDNVKFDGAWYRKDIR